MAYEPTIGEIQGNNIDAGVNTGTPAVNINLTEGLRAFNDAAHAKAQYDWAKYNQHLDMINKFAQNHQLDFAGVMQEDIPEIQKMANKYFSKITANPKLITQIGQDPDWVAVQAARAKSIQDNSVLQLQEKYRDQNPDLLNDENNQIAVGFRKAGLGRTVDQLQWKLPVTMDVGAMATKASERVSSPVNPYVRRVTDPVTGQYSGTLERVEGGVNYDRDKYLGIGAALYDSNQKSGDKYGHTVRDAANDMFSMLNKDDQETLKKKYGADAQKEYFLQSWMSYFKDKGGKEVSTQFRDRDFEANQRLSDDLSKMKVKFGYDKILKAMEGNQRMDLEFLKDKKDLQKGKFLNDFASLFVANAIGSGIQDKNVHEYAGKDGKKTLYHEAPASAQIKEIFGRETEKNGKKSKELPDRVWVSLDGSEILPIYNTGTPSTTGSKGVDAEKSTPLSIDDFKALVADKFKLTGSLEGASEDLIRRGFSTPTLNGGNALKYVNSRSTDKPQSTGTHIELKKTAQKQVKKDPLGLF